MRFLDSWDNAFGKLNFPILQFCRLGVILCIGSIFVFIILGVFFRYVLNDALVWYEEAAKFTLVWLCFLGTPLVMDAGGHVAIEIVQDRLTGNLKLFLILLTQVVILSTLGLLVWKGIGRCIVAGAQHSTAMPWLSMTWPYMSVPVGCILTVPVTIHMGIRKLKTMRDN